MYPNSVINKAKQEYLESPEFHDSDVLQRNERLRNHEAFTAYAHTQQFFEDGRIVPLKNEDIPEGNTAERICLITSFYDELSEARRNELHTALHNNLACDYIDQIILCVDADSYYTACELVKSIGLDWHHPSKISILAFRHRITYRDALSIARMQDDWNTVYLLSNSDCYFDESVNLLRKVDYLYGRRVIALTRKDLQSNGLSVADARCPAHTGTVSGENPNVGMYLPPWSSDAWAFKRGLADCDLNLDIELGRQHCEQAFLSTLNSDGYEIRNPGLAGFVRCIHIHNTSIRYFKNIKSQVSSFHDWHLKAPYNKGGVITTYNVDKSNYIRYSNMAYHTNNFYYDDRDATSGFGSFCVRDFRDLFRFSAHS